MFPASTSALTVDSCQLQQSIASLLLRSSLGGRGFFNKRFPLLRRQAVVFELQQIKAEERLLLGNAVSRQFTKSSPFVGKEKLKCSWWSFEAQLNIGHVIAAPATAGAIRNGFPASTGVLRKTIGPSRCHGKNSKELPCLS
jgi:hypothetical protein